MSKTIFFVLLGKFTKTVNFFHIVLMDGDDFTAHVLEDLSRLAVLETDLQLTGACFPNTRK